MKGVTFISGMHFEILGLVVGVIPTAVDTAINASAFNNKVF